MLATLVLVAMETMLAMTYSLQSFIAIHCNSKYRLHKHNMVKFKMVECRCCDYYNEERKCESFQ
jgi:hypothetical protein